MGNSTRKYPSIEKSVDMEYYPLSFQQDRLWYLSQLQPDSTMWNLVSCKSIEGKIDAKLLERSVADLIAGHRVLKTKMGFINNMPAQYFAQQSEDAFQYIDLSSKNALERSCETVNVLNKEALTPMQVEGGQLFCITLVKLHEMSYMIIIRIHHIISDASSFSIIWKGLKQIYSSYIKNNQGTDLSKLDYDYKDYVLWQRENFTEEYLKEKEEYWLKQFEAGASQLELPVDYSAPLGVNFKGALEKVTLTTDLVMKLSFLSMDKRVIMFSTLLAAYYILLQKYSHQSDIVIGTAFNGRHYNQKLQDIIGFFVNTVAIKMEIDEEQAVEAFLKQVHKKVDDAYYMQDYPFEKLIQKLNPERGNNRNPLFRVLFNMVTSSDEDELFEGVKKETWIESEVDSTQVDIMFDIHSSNEGISIAVEYNTDIFHRETILRFIKHYVNLLQNIVRNPKAPIKDLNILDEAEKKHILEEWNSTYSDYPKDKCIHELFEEQAEKTPDNIAVVYEGEQLTYKELNQNSNKLAKLLLEKGVKEEDIVAIAADRSIDMVTGILGILKAGAAYMPIDPKYPKDRIGYMLKDSDAKVLLIQKQLMHEIEFKGEVILLDGQEYAKQESSNIKHKGNGHSLAYIMYTSGSTGKPKGVMVEHINIVRLVKKPSYVSFEENDRILQTGAPVFDATTFEIWGALLNGLRLYLVREDVILNAEKLGKYIEENQVSILWLTSPLFNQLSEESTEIFKPLRYLLVGGDVLSAKHINNVRKACEKLTVINGYGPTENTTFSTCHQIKEDYEVSIPIGRPISGSTAYILDKHMKPVPVGAAGELCVGGDGLARGYLNSEELTAEKFVENPFKLGERLYKTGDLAKWTREGSIEFLGRIDKQVKIRGFRIELGEIEAKLLKHDRIKEAVVLAKEDERKAKYLCAYLAVDNQQMKEEEITVAELREYLSGELPEYMQPSYFVKLDKLPLNQNGKVDKKQLPEPEGKADIGTEYTAPENQTEERLAEIWKEILAVEKVGTKDSFFELGGHSLKATFLMSRLNKEFKIDIALREIFSNPTIKGLAERIKGSEKKTWADIKPVEKQEYYEASASQKRMYLINKMGAEGIEYNITAAMDIEGKLDKERLEQVFRELIERHEAFRTSFEIIKGQPVQRIHEKVDFEMTYIERPYEEADSANLVNDIIKEFMKPFNLGKAPLLRVALIKLNVGLGGVENGYILPKQKHCSKDMENVSVLPKQQHLLLLDLHHIIADGVSLGILYREIGELYKGVKLDKPKIQYKEFSAWQNGYLKSEEIKQQEEYWLEALSGELPVLDIIPDYPRSAVQSYEGDRISFKVGREISQGLRKICTESGATMYMVLLAAYDVLLAKYSGQEDIIVGTPVAGRYNAEVQNIVGMFVNTLAMRSKPEGQLSFREFLEQVRSNALKVYENQEYQFEEMVEKINTTRDLSRNPVFDVMFSMPNVDISEIQAEGLKFREREFEYKVAKFDLTLNAMDKEEEIVFELEYCTSLYKESTVKRIAEHYLNMLKQIVGQSEIRLKDIEIATEAEKKHILEEWNSTYSDYPKDKCIHELFEEQAEKTPDNIAVVYEGEQLTYKELNQNSNKLAKVLKDKGIRTNDVVAILMDKATYMIIGIMSILKCGAAYLPINPSYPKERIKYMLEDSSAKLVLTQKHIAPIMNIEAEALQLDDKDIYVGDTENAYNPISSSQTAYLIYTSGTTGKPKGVMVSHRALNNFLHTLYQRFDGKVGSQDNCLCLANISFDVSVAELFLPLAYGGTLVLYDNESIVDASKLVQTIIDKEISFAYIPPTILKEVHKLLTKAEKSLKLNKLLVGVEPISESTLEAYMHLNPSMQIVNGYGPTEATICAAMYKFVGNQQENGIVPIGKPINNTQIYILDKNMHLLPAGIAGELYISGDLLAQGYVKLPEYTAEKFIDNPFSSNIKMYKTGDLAKWLEDGNIQFIGRKDNQVKVRGYRIELGEIEKALLQYKAVKEAVAMVIEDSKGDKRIAAYMTLDKAMDVTENDVRSYIEDWLPSYMLPSVYVILEEMPVNANGKIDRKALLLLEAEVQNTEKYIAASTEIEKKLVEVIENILNISNLSMNDSFFNRGGTSLSMMRLISELEDEFEEAPSVVDIMNSKNISELAYRIQLLQEE